MPGHLITGTQRPAGLCIPVAATRQFLKINKSTLQGTAPAPRQNSPYSKPMRMMVHTSAAAKDLGIESVGGIRPEVEAAIEAALDKCLIETDVGIGKKYRVSKSFRM
jgi:hypothetical protein